MANSGNSAIEVKQLSVEEERKLSEQNTRLVPYHKAELLERQAQKHWDLFYKRNETRFFKDRHWTTREFKELVNDDQTMCRTILEVGCGVGNFFYPLIGEQLNFSIIACDLSPRAIEMVKNHKLYDETHVRAFQTDITTGDILTKVPANSIDISTLIFVLSAIHPDKFVSVLKSVYTLLRPGGIVLFRDYGLYDMAQLRFKSGHKISENFYMRQDGTRSYYFSTDFVEKLFQQAGFQIQENSYIHRRTINKKEDINVARIFVQVKAVK